MSRRQRLRAVHTAQRLADLYARPHRHDGWSDHQLRVAVTIAVARQFAGRGARVAADLSCGDGTILAGVPAAQRIYGDFAPGWPITGPIEETLEQIPRVDLFVCAETLEHLDDPDPVLARLRDRAATLILSTPVEAWDDRNEEHYWAWDRAAVEEMLTAAGWRVLVYTELDCRPARGDYSFGIWGCQ